MDDRFADLAITLAQQLVEKQATNMDKSSEQKKLYEKQVQEKVLRSMERFKDSFTRGYHVLLEELKNK